MKRFLLMVSVLLVLAPFSLQAEDFCMDCVHRFVYDAGLARMTNEASCCMANDQGDCFTGDRLMYTNIGHGCRVVADAESGGTRCQDEGTDANCGAATGGTGKKTGTISWECVYDAYGYCDVSCRSCTMT